MGFERIEDLLTRRQALMRVGAAALGTVVAPLLVSRGRTFGAAVPTVSGPPRQGGTLALSLHAIPAADMSPALAANAERLLTWNIYEGLVGANPATATGVRPVLAESWQVSPDGKVYTFRLRRGVRFQDGTPFNAETVDLNFQRLRVPTSRYFYSRAQAPSSIVYRLAERLEVVDEVTVRIFLSSRDPDFVYLLRRHEATFISQAVIKQFAPDEVGKHPIGTGPFQLIEQQEGSRYVLGRFGGYWDGAAYLERLVFRPYLDPTARVTALLAGEIDLVRDVSYDTVDRLKGRYAPFEWGPPYHWTVQFNMRNPVMQDVRVRQALNYAVNRDAIVQGIFRGFAMPAKGPATPSYPAWNPGLRGYPYDPKRAVELLAAAGHGGGLRLKAVNTSSVVPQVQEMSQSIQADLRKVGVDIAYDTLEPTAYFVRWRGGIPEEYCFAVSWWGTDFLGFLEQQFSQSNWPPNGVNRGWYQNAEVDRLLTAGREESSAEKRTAIYQRVERIIVNDAPWLFAVYFGNIGMRSMRVQNIRQGALELDYSKVWLTR